jgi:hypothetical protein
MADQEENVEQQEATGETPVEEAGEAIAEAAEEVAEEVVAAETATEPAAAEAEPAAAAGPAEEYSWEMLHKKTVAELRDVAQGLEHEALQGYSTMHKEQLVPALCEALGIEAHAHHEVVGINKDKVKSRIRALKVERQAAIEARDHAQLKLVRKRIKSLKRKIRRATV